MMISPLFKSLNPVQKLQEVMYEVAPLDLSVWSMVKGVSNVYWLWKFNRETKIYYNHWPLLLLGGALDKACQSTTLRIGAQALHVALKVHEHVQETKRFKIEVSNLARAIDGLFLPAGEHRWWIPRSGNWFTSPSSEARHAYVYQSFFERVSRIYFCALRVFDRLFYLTMHTLDVYEAAFQQSDGYEEAMKKSVVNLYRALKLITNNEKEIDRQIEKLVTALLVKWNWEAEVPAVMSKVRLILGTARAVTGTYDYVSESLGDGLKQAAVEYATVGLGVGGLIPAAHLRPARQPTE